MLAVFIDAHIAGCNAANLRKKTSPPIAKLTISFVMHFGAGNGAPGEYIDARRYPLVRRFRNLRPND